MRIYIYTYICKCALPVHVCGGHVYFLLSIMTVHMCAYYKCIIVLCITCVGHVSLSMCIFLYIKSLVLCYKISVVCYVQCILASLSTLRRNRIFNHFCIQVLGESWAVGFLRHSFVEYIHSNSTARTHNLLLLFLGNGELLLLIVALVSLLLLIVAAWSISFVLLK